MKNEISPLEAFRDLTGFIEYKSLPKPLAYDGMVKKIETALKDYERRLALAKEYKDINNVGKRLKAFEIIKETLPIDEQDFFYDEETNKYFFIGREVSKDRFDLLKEVLL